MGDPAGVGPEIIVGAWMETVVHEWCRPLVVGHPEIIRRAAALWRTGMKVVEIQSPAEAEPSLDSIPCLPCGSDEVLSVHPGVLDARAGHAAYEAVVRAARLAQAGLVDAIVTAPLQKEAMHRAGHHYPGHTELLAQLCGVEDFAMMLYLGPDEEMLAPYGLAVVHVTLHTALKKIFALLSIDEILAKARLADGFMSNLMQPFREGEAPAEPKKGRTISPLRSARLEPRPPEATRPPGIVKLAHGGSIRPRIGVCSVNPHGGEGGLFGEEEQTIIRPAVEKGIAEGLRLEGPLPTDTLMVRARDGRFDAIVAMYHDQGHIALKLMGMHRAVNVTSVAHGTAFDIAWRRQAETGSMIEAIRVAARLAGTKNS
jgi:4-hydroxythreonine-4-phosphate dehydrogenase